MTSPKKKKKIKSRQRFISIHEQVIRRRNCESKFDDVIWFEIVSLA